jgi:hypothetical protein
MAEHIDEIDQLSRQYMKRVVTPQGQPIGLEERNDVAFEMLAQVRDRYANILDESYWQLCADTHLDADCEGMFYMTINYINGRRRPE